MPIRLDHANVDVRNLEETIRFLTTAFPEFRIRGEGLSLGGERWVHLGTDDTYLALAEATQQAEPWVPYVGRPGLNHLGFEVDDAEAVRARLAAAGYRDSSVPNAHPLSAAGLLPRPRGERLGVRAVPLRRPGEAARLQLSAEGRAEAAGAMLAPRCRSSRGSRRSGSSTWRASG